jgi:hypothetical protein
MYYVLWSSRLVSEPYETMAKYIILCTYSEERNYDVNTQISRPCVGRLKEHYGEE